MSVRERFVADFSDDLASAIETAAEQHKNGVHDNKGSDPFKWALLITIGYECWSKPDYAKHHGIDGDADAIRSWIKEHGALGSHDGDCDFLAMMVGAYDEYVPTSEASA